MPLSRRRAFGGKLYERETGGTANVFLAAERLRGAERPSEVVFKLRDGEVTDEERESTRLVEGVGQMCGLVRPLIALEWVAELQIVRPAPPNASRHDLTGTVMRRPAVAAELAVGVSADMLLRSHTFGPNKQERQGRRARQMVQQMRALDSRSLVHAAIFDLLFASGDRHLEHVLMREGGAISLIDNAHTILMPREFTRHTANSLFLPGANFHARNLRGFPNLHCCTLRSTCPIPKPSTCPGTHTLYWPSLMLDYRCHVPNGRIGRRLPAQLETCLARLSSADTASLAASLRVPVGSRRLARLLDRARLLHARGFEGALRSSELSPGYYNEAALHNGLGVPAPCCSITLDATTDNRQDDEWRCHTPLSPPLDRAQWRDDGSLPYEAAGAPDVLGHPSAFLPARASAGDVAAAGLSGGLHSFSLTHRLTPTNRSLTPRFLVHQLGRSGDWHAAGRVDFMVQCEGTNCAAAHPTITTTSETDDDDDDDSVLGAEAHPRVVSVGGSRRPWWAHPYLSNFTQRAALRTATSQLRPSRLSLHRSKLLLQAAVLEARTLSLGRSLRADGVSLADVLARVQPELKLIAVLCEPAKRYANLRPHLKGRLSFDEMRSRFEACTERSPARVCAAETPGTAPLIDGMYDLSVGELARALPPSQLRLVRAEDVAKDPIGTAREALNFLGLEWSPEARQSVEEAAVRSSHTAQGGLQAERSSPAERVRRFYETHNIELVRLMDGDSRFAWPDAPHSAGQ